MARGKGQPDVDLNPLSGASLTFVGMRNSEATLAFVHYYLFYSTSTNLYIIIR